MAAFGRALWRCCCRAARRFPKRSPRGVRLWGWGCPRTRWLLIWIWQAGIPVAAPSANLFGRISPTTAGRSRDLDGRIDAVLDAGPTQHGVESTVLDPCRTPMIIYRPGAVTASQIWQTAGEVEFLPAVRQEGQPEAHPSPGMGLRHYAPRARLVLEEIDLEGAARQLTLAIAQYPGKRVGIMLPIEVAVPEVSATIFPWGRWLAPEELAQNLYAGLRWLDAQGCTVILCPLPPAEGIGAAVRDRLRRAARPTSAHVAQLVHVFDRRFVDQSLGVPADLEALAVVPLDAPLDLFPVLKHNHHGGLRLNLLLQIKELGMARRVLFLVCVGRKANGLRLHPMLFGVGQRHAAAPPFPLLLPFIPFPFLPFPFISARLLTKGNPPVENRARR